MGGAGEIGEGNENGGSEVVVPDADCVASGVAGVHSYAVDECSERGGEPDGEELETDRSGLSESWSLPGQDIVIHGGPPAVLSILHHA